MPKVQRKNKTGVAKSNSRKKAAARMAKKRTAIAADTQKKRESRAKKIAKQRSKASSAKTRARKQLGTEVRVSEPTKKRTTRKPKPKSEAPKNAKIQGKRERHLKHLSLQPRTPIKLPETRESRKGKTLRKLLRATPRLMVNNSNDVSILSTTRTKTRTGMKAITAKAQTTDPFGRQRIKKVRECHIIGLEKDKDGNPSDKPVNKQSKVLCQCNCENYVFTWEYANAFHGAARIVYSNGDYPNMTNPTLAVGLCKHLVALAQTLISKNL